MHRKTQCEHPLKSSFNPSATATSIPLSMHPTDTILARKKRPLPRHRTASNSSSPKAQGGRLEPPSHSSRNQVTRRRCSWTGNARRRSSLLACSASAAALPTAARSAVQRPSPALLLQILNALKLRLRARFGCNACSSITRKMFHHATVRVLVHLRRRHLWVIDPNNFL